MSLRAQRGALQYHGHGALHELAGRSAGHVAAGLRVDSGAYGERARMAYSTGLRIVDMVREDLTPSRS